MFFFCIFRYTVAGLFKDVLDIELHSIAGLLIEVTYDNGAVLMRQGEMGDDLFMVVKGQASICVDGVGEVAKASEGNFFGEIGLILDTPRSATVTAVGPLECMVLTREFYLANEGSMREGLVDKAKDMLAKNEEARNKKRKEQGGNTQDPYYYDPPDPEFVDRPDDFAASAKAARPSMF